MNNTHQGEAPRNTGWRIDQRVWYWCRSRTALLSFLLPIAVALIASYLLPQIPAHLYADSFRYQEWLSARQVEFKNWTPLLTAIGAFRIRETTWFRVLLALLIFVLLISLGEQIHLLLGPAVVRKPAPFYASTDAVSLTSRRSYLQTVTQVQQIAGPRTLLIEEQDASYLYAERRSWSRASTAVIYLGLLVLAGGLAIQTRGGWRQPEIRVLPYEAVGVGPSGDLQIQLLDVQTDTQHGAEQGAPLANLRIAGQTILPVRLGVPARHRGYRYLWVSKGGPSVQLSAYRVSDPDRALNIYDYAVRPVEARSLQFGFVSGQDPNRQFILSEDKVVGWLHWEDAGNPADADNPQFQLWLFGEEGQELGVATFETGQESTVLHAVIGDVDYRLEIAQYIVLDIAHQPAQWALWLGGTLLGLGILGLLIPHTQIWVEVRALDDHAVVKVREQKRGLPAPRGQKRYSIIARLRDALEPISLENASALQQAHVLPPEQGQPTDRNDQ